MKNYKDYLAKKKELKEQEFTPRENCLVCGFAKITCYCHLIKSFDSKIIFSILIHKLEIDRKIATGTMSHLILKNSYLIPGFDYTSDEVVNGLIEDPQNYCVVLYPGESSLDLSTLTDVEKKMIAPSGKQLVVFVIDGTWRTARQTMRISENLKRLPQISFSNSTPSNFRVRKQPSAEYCSTVEAIHHTINLLGDTVGFHIDSHKQDNLLTVFDYVVNNQISMKKNKLI
jgi:DTW domain-containing protein YfiP